VAYKEVNFKSKLLEWSQKNRVRMDFRMLKQKKDENGSPIFCFQVVLEGVAGEKGTGFSKKEAQQLASKETLQRLKREPQFVEAVFAAKTNRTQMEEEPAVAVPETERDIFIKQLHEDEEQKPAQKTQKPQKQVEVDVDDDADFDLSDISHKEKSREEIIAEAEAAAYDD
jgi:ribonuclease-3